jgi:serine/threonine-protein kinase
LCPQGIDSPETGAYELESRRNCSKERQNLSIKLTTHKFPQFRANFEQDGRLFLVQDYVEGKTYRELLNDRKAQTYIQSTNPSGGNPDSSAGVFSEAEIRQLLIQLVPVLDHVHSKGIIHRDITPDNIIRRNSDGLPVLIDFGVVKELATRIFTSVASSAPITTVGKVGYAPSEQIQTGRAYPSSDLYSLAATAVVLLTGKEPQALFDDNQLTWSWRRWANVSDELASVLNRMLSYRPGDRYQSATEVVQALQSPTPIPPSACLPPTSSTTRSQPLTSRHYGGGTSPRRGCGCQDTTTRQSLNP